MLRLLCALVLGLLFTGFAQANAAELYLDHRLVEATVAKAAQLPRLHALIVSVDGQPIVERAFRGPGLDQPVNIKSASKSIISALVGIAIDEGMIKDVNQPILSLIPKRTPEYMDPRV